jgi:hypothetical protein
MQGALSLIERSPASGEVLSHDVLACEGAAALSRRMTSRGRSPAVFTTKSHVYTCVQGSRGPREGDVSYDRESFPPIVTVSPGWIDLPFDQPLPAVGGDPSLGLRRDPRVQAAAEGRSFDVAGRIGALSLRPSPLSRLRKERVNPSQACTRKGPSERPFDVRGRRARHRRGLDRAFNSRTRLAPAPLDSRTLKRLRPGPRPRFGRLLDRRVAAALEPSDSSPIFREVTWAKTRASSARR